MRDLFNVPNTISLIRLALIPVFIWLVVVEEFAWAGALLGIIGATDWIDGFLARKLGQVTEIGKFLDPLADRIAVAVAVVAGLISGALPAWFAWALIVREGLVGLGAIYGWRNGVTKLDVRFLGKTATLMLYFAISSFYFAAGTDIAFFDWFGYLVGTVGLAFYYWVAVLYMGDMRSAIVAVRADD
jgi:cardiolipin synthase